MSSYFGSGGPSDSGFIDSLQSERKTRKASFWRMWENFAPGGWPGAAPDSCEATTIIKNKLQNMVSSEQHPLSVNFITFSLVNNQLQP